MLAFDFDFSPPTSGRQLDRDGRLHVAGANISKAMVSPYRGAELAADKKLGLDPEKIYQVFRDPDELARSAPTFAGVPILSTHMPVSAVDHRPDLICGCVGTDVVFADPYLKASLTIWTKAAIDDIESDDKRELSCGYHFSLDATPGVFRGVHFDLIFRDITGNHICIVESGRAGPEVSIGDSAQSLARRREKFSMRFPEVARIASYP